MSSDKGVDSVASEAGAGGGATPVEIAGEPPAAGLPAVLPSEHRPPSRRRLRRGLLFLFVLPVFFGAGYWWFHARPALPPGIASGNGRLEADEIDIDTKFAGRIAEMFVDEGDIVRPGQVVAMMDTRDIAASLKKSEALVEVAQRALDEAKADLAQQQTQVVFAKQELDRTAALVPKGFATVEQLDRRQQQTAAATAGLDAAMQPVRGEQYALDAATHDVELYRVNILDNTLVAPKQGPIEYRVANVGEVLPAARSSRCSTPTMSIWTSTCRRRKPAKSGSAPTPASCSTPIPIT
jgi:HlyD family secretion protein